jgi:hypothetical protein
MHLLLSDLSLPQQCQQALESTLGALVFPANVSNSVLSTQQPYHEAPLSSIRIHGGFGKIQGCTNIMFYACMLLLLYSVLRLIVVE